MDEATSNVDMSTDHLIQKAIRKSSGLFAKSTVITIAHRLNTVIDYDMILVLDDGQVVEYGVPRELLKKTADDPTAYFARMISETGESSSQALKQMMK
jgi:ABC-type multidrug transport system fused ATPase/permease subunit